MPGSSNTSFIPKRNPAQKERQGAKRQVFVGTFIIRILFFAALLAAAGVFIYEMQLQKKLDAEIVTLAGAIGTFNEAEMQRVLDTNARLNQAKMRFSHTVSVSSLLRALERSTVGSVQVIQLGLERLDDSSYEVLADMKTETFDSVLFQRSILEDSDTFVVSQISDLVLTVPPPDNALYSLETSSEEVDDGVSFKAILSVDTQLVPHTVITDRPVVAAPPVQPVIPVAATTSAVQTPPPAQSLNTDTI